MKKLIVFLAIILFTGIGNAQTSFNLEISGVKKQGGKLYVSLFNSEKSYKERNIYQSLVTSSISETVNILLTIPSGYYVFTIYQDNNGNTELDTNLLGIPKELFGFSNYNGNSPPGNFDKLKVMVNDKTKKVTVHLYKI